MQQLQLDSNQIFHCPFFHFALHPPPMWLEAAVRTIEAALPFFLNTIEASKMLSRKQLSAAVYTCSCYLWSDLSEICNAVLQIAAKPGYVQSWLILQIKAEFKSIDLHYLLV